MTDSTKDALYIKRDAIDTYHRRKLDEPSMYEILSWGDSGESFTGRKSKKKLAEEHKNKIKLTNRWITEKMDNFDFNEDEIEIQSSPKRFKSPHITVKRETAYDAICPIATMMDDDESQRKGKRTTGKRMSTNTNQSGSYEMASLLFDGEGGGQGGVRKSSTVDNNNNNNNNNNNSSMRKKAWEEEQEQEPNPMVMTPIPMDKPVPPPKTQAVQTTSTMKPMKHVATSVPPTPEKPKTASSAASFQNNKKPPIVPKLALSTVGSTGGDGNDGKESQSQSAPVPVPVLDFRSPTIEMMKARTIGAPGNASSASNAQRKGPSYYYNKQKQAEAEMEKRIQMKQRKKMNKRNNPSKKYSYFKQKPEKPVQIHQTTPESKKKKTVKPKSYELHDTRDMADGKCASKFNKPCFHNYGNGNCAPMPGGVVYGNYLLSHNVAPQVYPNNPISKQVFRSAETKGMFKNAKVHKKEFNMKINERMPAAFLEASEPTYSSFLNAEENKNQEKEERLKLYKENAQKKKVKLKKPAQVPWGAAAKKKPATTTTTKTKTKKESSSSASLSLSTPKRAVPTKKPTEEVAATPSFTVSSFVPEPETTTTTKSKPVVPVPIIPELIEIHDDGDDNNSDDKLLDEDIEPALAMGSPYIRRNSSSKNIYSAPATDIAINGDHHEAEGFSVPGDIVNCPKTYKLLPREWSRLIKPAGILYSRGNSVADCLYMYD